MALKGASRALLKAVSVQQRKKRHRTVQKSESILSSQTRREIFEFLCNRPCSRISVIAKTINISIPTVKWHIRKLLMSGYLKNFRKRRIMHYYPLGIISRDNINIYISLSNDINLGVFRYIYIYPGRTTDDMVHSLSINKSTLLTSISELKRSGLIINIRDGRKKRYFPTDKFDDFNKNIRIKWTAFRDGLMQKLIEERLFPNIKHASPDETSIEIIIAGKPVYIAMKTDYRRLIFSG